MKKIVFAMTLLSLIFVSCTKKESDSTTAASKMDTEMKQEATDTKAVEETKTEETAAAAEETKAEEAVKDESSEKKHDCSSHK